MKKKRGVHATFVLCDERWLDSETREWLREPKNLPEDAANALLMETPPAAPHECSNPGCPDDLNRRKLELLDEIVDLLPDIQRLVMQVTNTGLPGLQSIIETWHARYRELEQS